MRLACTLRCRSLSPEQLRPTQRCHRRGGRSWRGMASARPGRRSHGWATNRHRRRWCAHAHQERHRQGRRRQRRAQDRMSGPRGRCKRRPGRRHRLRAAPQCQARRRPRVCPLATGPRPPPAGHAPRRASRCSPCPPEAASASQHAPSGRGPSSWRRQGAARRPPHRPARRASGRAPSGRRRGWRSRRPGRRRRPPRGPRCSARWPRGAASPGRPRSPAPFSPQLRLAAL
mmetsp:Transcript_29467/g.83991  ORF Transcript_29467/g.83991 Transcript_29467/m.83991 type:complete len:230 (+) Transcript_29467:1451-2140(+)